MRKPNSLILSLGLASAGLAMASAPGQAADIYRPPVSVKDTPPVDYAPAITWTGFYIGGNIGAVWPDDELQIVNDNDAQLIGGGHIGFNWQGPSSWVIGVEGDVNFAEDVDYLASVRARLGYAFGRTLLYGTGGVAFAGFDNATLDEEVGWVAGGGIETKVKPNLSLGLEALYYDFDDASTSAGDDNAIDALTVRGRITIHTNGAREPLR